MITVRDVRKQFATVTAPDSGEIGYLALSAQTAPTAADSHRWCSPGPGIAAFVTVLRHSPTSQEVT